MNARGAMAAPGAARLIAWFEDPSFPPRTGLTIHRILVLAAGLLAAPVAGAATKSGDLFLGIAAATVVAVSLTTVGGVVARAVGRSRARARGGVRWWIDRDWGASGETRRVHAGLQPWRRSELEMFLEIGATLFGLLVVGGGTFFALSGWAACAVLASFAVVWIAARRWKGDLVVSWTSFPQFTGGPVAFHVGTSPGGARIDDASIALRCVREVPRFWFPWRRRVTSTWSGPVRIGDGRHLGPESFVPVSFDVGAHLPPTDLGARSPVYWEIVVLGRVGTRAYADRVLVPVYARVAS